jgi:hypothetical protein
MASDPTKLRKKMRHLLQINNSQWTPELLATLAEAVGLVINAPVVAPVTIPPESETKPHPFAKYLPRISVFSLVLGIARIMPPSLYWVQMTLIWLAGIAFIVNVFFEHWKRLAKCFVVLLVIGAEIVYSGANGVFDIVPAIEGAVESLRGPAASSAAGCNIYHVAIPVLVDLDRVSCKFQFPMDVVGFKVGTATETQALSGTLTGVSSTPDGECQLAQSLAVDTAGIYGTKSGPGIFRINARDVSKGQTIVGVFVLSKSKRSFFPPAAFSAEGSYYFNQRGRGLVLKPLTFTEHDYGQVGLK